jgi:muramoyltetrapeptide carboxypeptidase LdcA involved in peptidoglycan recycling
MFGHGESQWVIPIGATAENDADRRALVLPKAVVS